MTAKARIARRKLLELASEIANVSRASKVMGYSRQQFCEIAATSKPMGPRG